jgi:rubrerythrin
MKHQKKGFDRKQILEEFQAILALEERAALTYRQLAEDCDDREVKGMLEEIARQEMSHMKIAEQLVKLAKKMIKSSPGSRAI